jgi:hypothetical protein
MMTDRNHETQELGSPDDNARFALRSETPENKLKELSNFSPPPGKVRISRLRIERTVRF